MNLRYVTPIQNKAQDNLPEKDLHEALSWHHSEDVLNSSLYEEVRQMDDDHEVSNHEHISIYISASNLAKYHLEHTKEKLEKMIRESAPKADIDQQKTFLSYAEESVIHFEKRANENKKLLDEKTKKYNAWNSARGNKLRELVYGSYDKLLARENLQKSPTNSASRTAIPPLSAISSSLWSGYYAIQAVVTDFLANPEVQEMLVEGTTALVIGSVSSFGLFANNTSPTAQLAAPQRYTNTTRMGF